MIMKCANSGCTGLTSDGRMHGLCPHCWLKLNDGQRYLLQNSGKPMPPPEIHEHHHHDTHVYNRPKLRDVIAFGLLCGAAGSALAHLAAWAVGGGVEVVRHWVGR